MTVYALEGGAWGSAPRADGKPLHVPPQRMGLWIAPGVPRGMWLLAILIVVALVLCCLPCRHSHGIGPSTR